MKIRMKLKWKWRQMKRKPGILYLLLALVAIAGLTTASLAQSHTYTCPGHPAHDEACGYVEAVQGHPCNHQHTDACYEKTLRCAHVHTEACGENGETCTHVHTDACYEKTLHCTHTHDETCGYVEAVQGHPCSHACPLCSPAGKLNPDKATFDRNPQESGYRDIEVTFQKGADALSAIEREVCDEEGKPVLKEDEKGKQVPEREALEPNRDYALSEDGQTVTLRKEFLQTLPVGEQTLHFVMESEAEQAFALSVVETESEAAADKETADKENASEAANDKESDGKKATDEKTTGEATDSKKATSEAAASKKTDDKSAALTAGDWNYKVSLKWDDTDKKDKTIKTLSQDPINLKYTLTIDTNAAEYEPWEMEIRIPAMLWETRTYDEYKDRGHDYYAYNPSDVGVPQAPNVSDTIPFQYEYEYEYENNGIDGVEYLVFRNPKKVESGSRYLIEVAYQFAPISTFDMSKAVLQAKATATANRGGAKEEQQVSDKISVEVNTGLELNRVSTGSYYATESLGFMYQWKSEFGPKPADFDNYKWYVYGAYVTGTANQPSYLTYEWTLDHGGEVYQCGGMPRRLAIDSFEGNKVTLKPSFIEKEGSYSGYGMGGFCEGEGTQVYFITRYPKNKVQEGDQLTFTVKGTAKGVDGFDSSGPKQARETVAWKDYRFSYDGNIISIDKHSKSESELASIALVLLESGTDVTNFHWSINATANGYDYPGYTYEVADDLCYWENLADYTYTQMTPEDYEFTSVDLRATSYQVDRTNGNPIYWEKGDPAAPKVELYAQVKGKADYQKIEGAEFRISDLNYRVGSSDTNNTTKTVKLPAGTYRVKAKVSGGIDYTKIEMDLWTTYRGSSPFLREWFESPKGEGFQLHNLLMAKFYDKNGTWVHEPSSYSYGKLGEMVKKHDADTYGGDVTRYFGITGFKKIKMDAKPSSKTGTIYNDTVNRQARIPYTLEGKEQYSGLQERNFHTLIKQGWEPPTHKEMVFYDLLPIGTFYDEEQTPRYLIGGKSGSMGDPDMPADLSVETIDDYKGCGRQMVIFRITMKEGKEEESFYINGSGRIQSKVTFDAIVPYQNLPFASDGKNLAAYQHDGGAILTDLKNTYAPIGADDCRTTTTYNNLRADFTAVTGADGNPVFYDLRGDGVDDTKDTMYMSCPQKLNISTAHKHGLSKTARSKDDNPAANFDEHTVALVGGGYEYRLQLENTEGGTMKDVILFDKLEQAANREGHTGETGWKGTFRGFDMRYVSLQGIKPTVYYNTLPDMAYFTIDDVKNGHLPAGWTTTEPADKSAVTGIAVDLSKKKDGSDYTFPSGTGAAVVIKMDSPKKMPQEKYAYNHSAFYSKSSTATGQSGKGETLESSRTRVELVDLEKLIKTADPAGGETKETATEVRPGQILTYTLTYNAGRPKEYITVTDVLPKGLSLVKGSIRYTQLGGTEKAVADSAYDPATRTITWPTFSVSKYGDSTFTFQAMVEPLKADETRKVYENTAKARREGEKELLVSNTTYHQQHRREADLAKTAALLTGVEADDPDAATGGTVGSEARGSAAEPIKAKLGQLVEYHLTVPNTGGAPGTKSGEITVTDRLPSGTRYIAGSMKASFRSTADPTKQIEGSTATASAEEMKENGKTVGVKWTLGNLSDGEEAYLTFRVRAPKETDDPGTEAVEGTKIFENTAQLSDQALKEEKYTKTVTVVDPDGNTTTHTQGEAIYTKADYQKESQTTYHQVKDLALHRLRIIKDLKDPDGGAYTTKQDETFVFEITGKVEKEDGSEETLTFYQIVTVEEGNSQGSADVGKLLPGEYTVKELDSNWRFTVQGNPSQTQQIDRLDRIYTYAYQNKLTNEKWEDGKARVTNVMPPLNE